MNWWPYSIIAVFVLFAAFIGQFVYQSTLHDVNLVSENYYEKEVAYQDQIDLEEKTLPYNKHFVINISEGQLHLQCPIELPVEEGKLVLLRPSSAKEDQTITLSKNETNSYKLKTSALSKGLWIVEVHFSSGGEDYFYEEKVMII